jgi:hypothetical protein
MAMIASKGPDDAPALSEGRSVLLEPSRSPAPSDDEVEDWICDAEKSLRRFGEHQERG